MKQTLLMAKTQGLSCENIVLLFSITLMPQSIRDKADSQVTEPGQSYLVRAGREGKVGRSRKASECCAYRTGQVAAAGSERSCPKAPVKLKSSWCTGCLSKS
jgi:hypothetical protein